MILQHGLILITYILYAFSAPYNSTGGNGNDSRYGNQISLYPTQFGIGDANNGYYPPIKPSNQHGDLDLRKVNPLTHYPTQFGIGTNTNPLNPEFPAQPNGDVDLRLNPLTHPTQQGTKRTHTFSDYSHNLNPSECKRGKYEITNDDIFYVYVNLKSTLTKKLIQKLTKKLARCKILWLYMQNNKKENIIFAKKCIFRCSSDIGLIFQWQFPDNYDYMHNSSLSKLEKLSNLLENSGIKLHTLPFLLFIDPISYFLGNDEDYSFLYHYIFSSLDNYKNSYKYSVLYFLYTCYSKTFYDIKYRKIIYPHMNYYRLFHPGLKYYSIISTNPDFIVPIYEIFPPTSDDNIANSKKRCIFLDHFISYPEIEIVIKINGVHQTFSIKHNNFIKDDIPISNKEISIYFNLWNESSIEYKGNDGLFDLLIIKNISIDNLITQNKESNEIQEKSPDYIKNIFHWSLYRYNNMFTKKHPAIDNIKLYFTTIHNQVIPINENNNQNISNIIPPNFNINPLEKVSILLAFAVTSFFSAKNLEFYLPFLFYNFDKLPKIFSYSPEEISNVVKSAIGEINDQKKYIENSSSPIIAYEEKTNHIILKKFWCNENEENSTENFSSPTPDYIQSICNKLMKYGLFLTSPTTEKVILYRSNYKVILTTKHNEEPLIIISFEGSDKQLCFKHFHISQLTNRKK